MLENRCLWRWLLYFYSIFSATGYFFLPMTTHRPIDVMTSSFFRIKPLFNYSSQNSTLTRGVSEVTVSFIPFCFSDSHCFSWRIPGLGNNVKRVIPVGGWIYFKRQLANRHLDEASNLCKKFLVGCRLSIRLDITPIIFGRSARFGMFCNTLLTFISLKVPDELSCVSEGMSACVSLWVRATYGHIWASMSRDPLMRAPRCTCQRHVPTVSNERSRDHTIVGDVIKRKCKRFCGTMQEANLKEGRAAR